MKLSRRQSRRIVDLSKIQILLRQLQQLYFITTRHVRLFQCIRHAIKFKTEQIEQLQIEEKQMLKSNGRLQRF